MLSPGFRPGKAPARVIKQRFKDQILHDVAQDLVPKAVDEALRARGVEPVDTPDIRDVTVEEGQTMTEYGVATKLWKFCCAVCEPP